MINIPKFCGYCGSKADSEAKVCGVCGKPFGTPPIAPMTIGRGAALIPTGKQLKAIVIAAACVLALILAVSLASGTNGSERAAKKAMDAFLESDIDVLMDLSSDFCYADAYEKEQLLEVIYQDYLTQKHAQYHYAVGAQYHLSYRIRDSYAISEVWEQQLYVAMAAVGNFDAEIIEKISIVEVELTAKASGNGDYVELLYLILSKESGTWRLFDLGTGRYGVGML